ncbi:hypothetical protein [Uliginosibacterium sediminicola]|uniref:Glycosyltransferase RgtA/B/C/D-like domain-containing protein n=1 Tax=Uliginosibacterium sediminicola TaxID=2024550 RepID=A0ABU9Z1B9_9RHOO
MNALLRHASTWLAALLLLLLANAWWSGQGYLSSAVLQEWATVMRYAAGHGSYREFLSSYPPLAFLLNVLLGVPLHWLSSLPTPLLLASMLSAGLLALWRAQLLRAGWSGMASALAVLLVLINPLFLYLLSAGISAILLLGALYWFAAAFCASHRHGRVSDLMSLALSLVCLVFVHPFGQLFALVALPFLVLVLPQALLARSVFNSLLVLLFPLLFSILSFVYVVGMFDEAPASFLAAALQHPPLQPAALSASHTHGGAGSLALGLALGVLPSAWLILRRPPAHARRAVLLLILMCVLAAALQLCIQASQQAWSPGLGEALIALAPCMGVLLALLRDWPLSRLAFSAALAVLLASLLLAGLGLLQLGTGEAARWRDAGLGRGIPPAESASIALGKWLAQHTDILLDAQAHPALLAARGGARGLIVPGDEAFSVLLLGQAPQARFVVLPDPLSAAGEDQLNQRFPEFYLHGMPGYHLEYETYGWRVYERNPSITTAP